MAGGKYVLASSRNPKRRRKSAPKRYALASAGYGGKELKFIDSEVTSQSIVGTVTGSESDPTQDSLNGVTQGDGESTRDGRRTYIHSVQIRGVIAFNHSQGFSTPTTDSFVRLALVLDTQTNGAQLNAEDVFKDPTNVNLDWNFLRNLSFTKRFRVLKQMDIHDENYPVGAAGDGTTNVMVAADTLRPFSINYNFKKPVVCTYTSTSNAISEITDNSLHLIAIEGLHSNEASTMIGELSYVSRVRFTS